MTARRTGAPGTDRRRSGWIAFGSVLALALPLSALAQTAPVHDMDAMPGMTMDAPKKVVPPSGNVIRKSTKKRPVTKHEGHAADGASGSGDAMPGMDHGAMPGMDPSPKPAASTEPMPGMDHGSMPGMNHGAKPAAGKDAMPGMDHGSMPGMDHGAMRGMGQSPKPAAGMEAMPGMDHGAMPGMDHGSMPGMDHSGMDMSKMDMQGGSAPADARDPDYSEGVAHGPMTGMDMADDARFGSILIDQLEGFHSNEGSGVSLRAQAWYGGDINKLWLKAEGEKINGRLGATRTEALWNHATGIYWGTQLGVRHDFGGGPARTWAAFGVEGLSPYWFDIEATAYAGESGRTALRFEAQYELLLTQRLILQPDVEVNVYGKNDRERGIGSGFSNIDTGLRLRYEITRKFAPYVGISFNRQLGNTARMARDDGDPVSSTSFVVGIRMWY